ncbi:hypothetical protein Tco_0150591 [Tanacetum coccineum]
MLGIAKMSFHLTLLLASYELLERIGERNSSWHNNNNNNKEMSHKTNCVHPTSALISWIQTRNESKFKFKFVLDTKELTVTVADFRRIFRLPQATDNNHDGFVDDPTFI